MGEKVLHLYYVGQLSYFQEQLRCLWNAILVFGYRFRWHLPFCWIFKMHCCWNTTLVHWCLFHVLFRLILKTRYYQNVTSIHWSHFRIIFRWISFQQKDKRCQWMWEDEFYFLPSISHPQHWWLILQWRYRLLNISNSKFGQYSLSQEFRFLALNFKFWLARYFVFWTLWHSFQF